MTIHTMWDEVQPTPADSPTSSRRGDQRTSRAPCESTHLISRVCHLCRGGVPTWEVPSQRQGCCMPWHSYPRSRAGAASCGVTAWGGRSQSGSWGGPLDVSTPTSCPKQGQLWGQTRLLRVCSRQGLKSDVNREPTPSLGTPLSNFPHNGKVLTLYSVRIYLISIYYHCVLFSSHALTQKLSPSSQ